MTTLFISVAIVMSFNTGVVLAWHWIRRKMRYRDPQLHEGRWERQVVRDRDVMWRNTQAPRTDIVARALREGTHRHAAALCTLTVGLAHEDTCVCGARRYGIFGSWYA